MMNGMNPMMMGMGMPMMMPMPMMARMKMEMTKAGMVCTMMPMEGMDMDMMTERCNAMNAMMAMGMPMMMSCGGMMMMAQAAD
jgi:hypothetical protein